MPLVAEFVRRVLIICSIVFVEETILQIMLFYIVQSAWITFLNWNKPM